MITKHNIEEYFADFLDGGLDVEKTMELNRFLDKNPELRQEFEDLKSLYQDLPAAKTEEPNEFLDLNFYGMLEQEKGKKEIPKSKIVAFMPNWQSVMKFAAMIIALVGAYLMGFRSNEKQIVTIEKPIYITREIPKTVFVDKITIPQKNGSTNTAITANKSANNQTVLEEIKNIRKEVTGIQDVQKRMILAMLKQESASARLQAVNYSYDMTMADDTLLNALIRTLDYDPSVNVRMAAVEAVGRFGKSPMVRTSLVNSLMKQNDPSMQIAVIDMLIELRERRAVPILASLAESSQLPDFVKEKAENGIKLLTM
ncbi:MAG: HEAT repeat domain-containing protein [Spirosomaceae bacterium]|nr:HEAT repeat domain-containing protein [Spirosomataceae bacterium]